MEQYALSTPHCLPRSSLARWLQARVKMGGNLKKLGIYVPFYLTLYITIKLDVIQTDCFMLFSWILYIALLPRPTSCFGATSGKQDRALDSEQQCAHAIFTSPAANLAPYELNFQLLVRGACLLAGTAFPLKHLWFSRSWLNCCEILE